jgi:hypothetical protein
MANIEQLEILKQGVDVWNKWRQENKAVTIDLSKSNFDNANLERVDLRSASLYSSSFCKANLERANLNRADLWHTNLRKARLANASVQRAKLSLADLREADLRKVNFSKTDFREADLRGADLSEAILEQAQFVDTKLHKAVLSNCFVYGISAWNLDLEGTIQKDLIITERKKPEITVDDLEIAQFIFLILNNQKLKDVINSISSRGVLILGRFAIPERKAVLDGLKEKLRDFNLLPIVFDFDRPVDRDLTETVQALASMSMFVIVDVTNPKSTPLEMEATVKQFMIPYLPIIDVSVDEHPFAMMTDLHNKFHWVLQPFGYKTKEQLFDNIKVAIIDRAVDKVNELRKQKARNMKILTLDDLTG